MKHRDFALKRSSAVQGDKSYTTNLRNTLIFLEFSLSCTMNAEWVN